MKVKKLKTKFRQGLLVLAVVIAGLTASPISNTGDNTSINLQQHSAGEVVAGSNFGMDVLVPPPPPTPSYS